MASAVTHRRPSRPRIAITGASGFLGSALAAELTRNGIEVIRLRRTPSPTPPDISWDPVSGMLDPASLEGVDVVINLAGEPIAQRWTKARKHLIVDSRVRGTELLARTIAAFPEPPRVLVSGSAIGIYDNRGDDELDEESSPGHDFLARTAAAWEAATEAAQGAGIRVVLLRTGIVLGKQGGALAKLLLPFRFGLGGRVGTGRQWMSWIALTDWIAAVQYLLAAKEVTGPVNLVAPNPVPNLVFARTLARVLGRPAIARLPAWAVELSFGEMGRATLLASQRVHPRRLTSAGFDFALPTLEQALRRELNGAVANA
jgi:uncharacterized protein (TIGR01777 family)